MSVATFWNQEHPLSEKATELYDKMVPLSGSSTCIQGELLRASSRINYDWFNNGWGCNNWSGAVKFIENKFSTLPNQPNREILKELKEALEFVYDYSHGEPCPYDYSGRDHVSTTVTKIHEIVVNAILENPDLINTTEDMLDYQEDEYRPNYEDDEENQY